MEAVKVIRKSYKFRIYPTKSQVAILENTLDLCRELYNAALQERREAWRLHRISINYFDQNKQLPEIKKIREDLTSVYSSILQDILRQVDKTYRAYFSRVQKGEKAGLPRFKGKNRYNSFCYSQSGFSLTGNKLTLSKIGKLRIKLSRPVFGKVKTCRIKREAGIWFVVFSVETFAETLPKTNQQIGIDVGIENFLTLSDGTKIENFRFFENSQKRLRKAQRKVSRRKRGSNRHRKAVREVRKIHLKIKNQRNDFQHKLSTRLVKEFDLIAIENLNIKGLASGLLAKQITDTAWSAFFEKLKYKAENAGKSVIEVNPKGTSQTCICGEKVEKKLSQRLHKCAGCGYENHRDIVSAQVILQRAVGQTVLALSSSLDGFAKESAI